MAILKTFSPVADKEEFDLDSNITWKKLYELLEPLARYLVYSSHNSSWQGQEKDIIEDVVQETVRRVIERSQKAARGEAPPIQSLRSMLFTIARNYCVDLCRHDRRLTHMHPRDTGLQTRTNQVNPAEEGIENVYLEMLFRLVASEVVTFPDKQRRAILVDLANRMHFDRNPTALQQAFLDAGVDLQEYRQALPSDPLEKSRHTALVGCAYRRVVNLLQVQKYIALV